MYFLVKNLKLKRLSKRLNYIKIKLFLIKEEKGPDEDAKGYFIFYITLLELADTTIPLQTTFYCKTKEETKYKVKKILKKDGQNYLIK